MTEYPDSKKRVLNLSLISVTFQWNIISIKYLLFICYSICFYESFPVLEQFAKTRPVPQHFLPQSLQKNVSELPHFPLRQFEGSPTSNTTTLFYYILSLICFDMTHPVPTTSCTAHMACYGVQLKSIDPITANTSTCSRTHGEHRKIPAEPSMPVTDNEKIHLFCHNNNCFSLVINM